MIKRLLAGCVCFSALYSAEYGFLDYYFVDPDHPIHVAGRYRQIGEANFRRHKRGDLKYADAYGTVFYTGFLNLDNSLTWGLGYDYLKLDWEKNPRFKEENFNYFNTSLGYVSTSLEQWRWIVNGGLSVDASNFNFGQTAVYHGMLWGRYDFATAAGMHVGVLGWYGVKNGYTLPIFGFDWKMGSDWTVHAIFPIDVSLNYAFNDYWSMEVAYSGFGGPYRYPRRAYEGINGYHDPIFMVYSKGVDLNLLYKFEHFLRVDIGGGWNFGGWVLVKDGDNRKEKYYHFNGAPYAQATVAFTF